MPPPPALPALAPKAFATTVQTLLAAPHAWLITGAATATATAICVLVFFAIPALIEMARTMRESRLLLKVRSSRSTLGSKDGRGSLSYRPGVG